MVALTAAVVKVEVAVVTVVAEVAVVTVEAEVAVVKVEAEVAVVTVVAAAGLVAVRSIRTEQRDQVMSDRAPGLKFINSSALEASPQTTGQTTK